MINLLKTKNVCHDLLSFRSYLLPGVVLKCSILHPQAFQQVCDVFSIFIKFKVTNFATEMGKRGRPGGDQHYSILHKAVRDNSIKSWGASWRLPSPGTAKIKVNQAQTDLLGPLYKKKTVKILLDLPVSSYSTSYKKAKGRIIGIGIKNTRKFYLSMFQLKLIGVTTWIVYFP